MKWRFICRSEKSKLGSPCVPELGSCPDHAQQGHPGPRQGIAAAPGEVSQEQGMDTSPPSSADTSKTLTKMLGFDAA